MMKLFKLGARNRAISQILITIVYFQTCYLPTFANIVNQVCQTSSCRKLGDYYKKNMNEQGKPCTDFYDYVCHNWETQNPRPKHKMLWSVDEYQSEQSIYDLKVLLENIQVSGVAKYERAKFLYRACMNLPFMERADSVTIKGIMKAAGNWPMFVRKDSKLSEKDTWWQTEIQYINKAGESSILCYYLIADIYRDDQVTLLLCPSYSPFGALYLYYPLDKDHRKLYKEFLIDVIDSVAPFGIKNFTNIIDTELNSVIEFREQIARIGRQPQNSNGTVLMKIEEFQRWYDKQSSEHDAEKINWLTVIRSMYKNSKDAYRMTVQSSSIIAVHTMYFAELVKILARTPKHVIENHVHLYFAERHLKLNSKAEANLQKIFSNGVDQNGQIRYEPERWAKCVEDHNMAGTLGQMYTDAYFSHESQTKIQNLLNEEIGILEKQLLESSWMNSITKITLTHKLHNLHSQIGFADLTNTTKNSKKPRIRLSNINPSIPDAYYLESINKICVSAAHLQWPIYMPNLPHIINYASTGVLLAHELYHAFDYNGLQYDELGNKRAFLTKDMRDKYVTQADCFEEKYKKFEAAEIQKRGIIPTPHVETVNEDIADAMGLKLAYNRHRQALKENNKTCSLLPGFENFDCDQLFFISFANAFCANSPPSVEEKIILSDHHSLPKIRVNGAVGNMKEFHRAFKCKRNDAMASEEMCDLWK